jgi:hypothetical protein
VSVRADNPRFDRHPGHEDLYNDSSASGFSPLISSLAMSTGRETSHVSPVRLIAWFLSGDSSGSQPRYPKAQRHASLQAANTSFDISTD